MLNEWKWNVKWMKMKCELNENEMLNEWKWNVKWMKMKC